MGPTRIMATSTEERGHGQPTSESMRWVLDVQGGRYRTPFSLQLRPKRVRVLPAVDQFAHEHTLKSLPRSFYY
jgi:hypothetical protein